MEDYRQKVPLKFKVGDIVYIASRYLVRKCEVMKIGENDVYDEDDYDTTNEIYTFCYLKDLNDKGECWFYIYTEEKYPDLNTKICTDFKDLFNFDPEE